MSLKSIKISPVTIIVMADGKTDADINNKKGHLFEQFMALVFSQYGYAEPKINNLNVTQSGIEIDIDLNHKVESRSAIAECKAYSTALNVQTLTSFYGKLTFRRFEQPDTTGYFVALPGLTQAGNEQASKIKKQDKKFELIDADKLETHIRDLRLISDKKFDFLTSDQAVIITEYGVFSAIKEVDEITRLAKAIHVWGTESVVPDPVISLIENSVYSSGILVNRVSSSSVHKQSRLDNPETILVEVVGGNSDFEYQFPTSPRFFVGRENILRESENLLRNERQTGRVFVLNGQSGWGKSSLALRIRESAAIDKFPAIVLDTRTASTPEYVWQALQKLAAKAEEDGVISLDTSASFSSLNSSLLAFKNASWKKAMSPLLLIFDQFENVFRSQRLTQEFRDLALSVRDLSIPIIIGFCWKTDVAGLVDKFPHQFRDDISAQGRVFLMEPFGPKDINVLLNRLEKEIGEKLSKDLTQRLREYSQGLPWLFKKLANHLLQELRAGASQGALVQEALNIKRLFDSDLAELSALEREALQKIAKRAPIFASDALDIVDSNILTSLLHRRLIVEVGGRYDTYWDIFRDFLNTGDVPIEDTYILRVTPNSVLRVLNTVLLAGGEMLVQDAANTIDTTEGVIFNAARDLRQIGVFVEAPGHIKVSDEIAEAFAAGWDKAIEAAKRRAFKALQRHRAYSILKSLSSGSDDPVDVDVFATALPDAYPAVSAAQQTWRTYAKVFAAWFKFARLADIGISNIQRSSTQASVPVIIFAPKGLKYPKRVFPQASALPAISILRLEMGFESKVDFSSRTIDKAVSDLIAIGILVEKNNIIMIQNPNVVDDNDQLNALELIEHLKTIGGGTEAIERLRHAPETSPLSIGEILANGQGVAWSEGTKIQAGKYFRSWARQCGITTSRKAVAEDDFTLDLD